MTLEIHRSPVHDRHHAVDGQRELDNIQIRRQVPALLVRFERDLEATVQGDIVQDVAASWALDAVIELDTILDLLAARREDGETALVSQPVAGPHVAWSCDGELELDSGLGGEVLEDDLVDPGASAFAHDLLPVWVRHLSITSFAKSQ